MGGPVKLLWRIHCWQGALLQTEERRPITAALQAASMGRSPHAARSASFKLFSVELSLPAVKVFPLFLMLLAFEF